MDTTDAVSARRAAARAPPARLPALARTPLAHRTADLDGDASAGLSRRAAEPAVAGGVRPARSYAPGARRDACSSAAPLSCCAIRLFHAGSRTRRAAAGLARRRRADLRRLDATRRARPSAPGRAASTTRASPRPGRGAWYAPFVLRPRRLGDASRRSSSCRRTPGRPTTSRTATPGTRTRTSTRSTSTRPFIDGGVPPHYHGYDRGFIRWLALDHKHADFLSDDDLDRIASARARARVRPDRLLRATRNT